LFRLPQGFTTMTSLALIALLQLSALGAQDTDYAQAYQRSLATGRPLLVLVGAPWCPACEQMKHSVLPQVAEAGGLNDVVFAYVDFDQQQELASRLLESKSIPQLIRLDRTDAGWNRRVLVGAKTPREVFSFVQGGRRPESDRPARLPPVTREERRTRSADWLGAFSAMNPFAKNPSQAVTRP
jgi:thiol-disulfide isomerase/thioredoxin